MQPKERRWKDIQYSYELAKRMEQFRSNPVLGYRPAGSEAEYKTGEMLKEEMEKIGLKHIRKDRIAVDAWEFHRAEMFLETADGKKHHFQLGAYQTNFRTEGKKAFSLVYVGKGTAADYEGKDVEGKLVLADINQRDEWWINFPVYQAHIRKAAAFIAVQEGGFAGVCDTALNAQDIAGPADAPAFSMSRADAAVIKKELEGKEEISVFLDAETYVKEHQVSYNIIGEIPGREREQMILLSAHYDSYFSGFQDDNAAVAMMFGIARAWIRDGYRPQKTIVIAALAAEEWGITNSKYDWSTGAYQQVFHVRPQWQGKVVADLNFELPAHGHSTKDAVRCVYEYATFLEQIADGFSVPPEAYPDGLEVRYPIETMSDDFSMAIAGIPSMVNDFAAGQFMETHYHSQFDNDDYYQEPVYSFHHQLYRHIAECFDKTVLPPFDFSRLFEGMKATIDLTGHEISAEVAERENELYSLAVQAAVLGKKLYGQICIINEKYDRLLNEGEYERAAELSQSVEGKRRQLMKVFRKSQDSFVRLDWHDQVLFPQQAVRKNISNLQQAIRCLSQGSIAGALEAVYEIDNNRYAFLFEEEVFRYFTEYVFCQPKERLQWGAGRIVRHESLFGLVSNLKKKEEKKDGDTEAEIRMLKSVLENQLQCYLSDLDYMIRETKNCVFHLEKIMGKEQE